MKKLGTKNGCIRKMGRKRTSYSKYLQMWAHKNNQKMRKRKKKKRVLLQTSWERFSNAFALCAVFSMNSSPKMSNQSKTFNKNIFLVVTSVNLGGLMRKCFVQVKHKFFYGLRGCFGFDCRWFFWFLWKSGTSSSLALPQAQKFTFNFGLSASCKIFS